MASTRSSAEETIHSPKYKTSGIDDVGKNVALHGQKEKDNLELGSPAMDEWGASFGEGEMENLKVGGGVDPVFEAKAAVLNHAFQHMGMGKYQWKLFLLCGFGWVLLPLCKALVLCFSD